jgi:hypothetical protein
MMGVLPVRIYLSENWHDEPFVDAGSGVCDVKVPEGKPNREY